MKTSTRIRHIYHTSLSRLHTDTDAALYCPRHSETRRRTSIPARCAFERHFSFCRRGAARAARMCHAHGRQYSSRRKPSYGSQYCFSLIWRSLFQRRFARAACEPQSSAHTHRERSSWNSSHDSMPRGVSASPSVPTSQNLRSGVCTTHGHAPRSPLPQGHGLQCSHTPSDEQSFSSSGKAALSLRST